MIEVMSRKPSLLLLLVILSAFLILTTGLGGCARWGRVQPGSLPAPVDVSDLVIRGEPVPEWEALFRKDAVWRGADGCATVPMTPDTTLWLFGDTWMKPDGTPARKGGTIVRNTLALQQWDADGPRRPEFFWTTDPTSGTLSALLTDRGRGFLWPLSGVRLRDCLFLFTVQVVFSPTEFSVTRTPMLIVRNPNEGPPQWDIAEVDIPWFRADDKAIIWFSGTVFVRENKIYLYGVRQERGLPVPRRSLLLARVPEDDFLRVDFSAWRFWSGTGWSPNFRDAAPLFEGVSSEYSVSWLPALRAYVAVYSSDEVRGDIVGRFAPAPEGPWGPPRVLFQCRDDDWNPNYPYYAGKAHPELAAADNELIVTYATNGAELADLVKDERIYWPRFARVVITQKDPKP